MKFIFLSGYLAVSALSLPVGTVITSVGEPSNRNWMNAAGQCLADREFPALAKALYSESAGWPYGRCDLTHFKLPDYSCRLDAFVRKCHYILVK